MAKIPTYEAGKLASARTAVLPADTSGEDIGKAVSSFGATMHDVFAEKKRTVDALNIDSAKTDYQTQYIRKTHEILKDPSLSSENVEERLQQARTDIKSGILSSITDGSVRQAVEVGLQDDINAGQIEAAKTRYEIQDKETVNRIFSNSSKLIDVVSETGDVNKIPWAFKKLDETEATLLPFMNRDVANTQKYIQNSKDALIKQFVAQGISSGREDELDSANVLGKFSGATSATQEQISKDITTALETKKYRANITTSFQVLNDNQQTYKDLRDGVKSFADIEHQLSEQTYSLMTGKFSPEQERDIRGRITFLNSMRTAQLNGSYVRGRDDLDTLTSLQSELGQLISTSEGSKQLNEGVYLEQLKTFQDKLTKAFVDDQKLSGKSYNTLYSEASGVLLKDLTSETFKKTGWFQTENTIPEAMKPFVSKDSRLPILRIYDTMKGTDGSIDSKAMVAAFQEYLDDKEVGNAPVQMTPDVAVQYSIRAKMKLIGYPGSYKTGDPIMVQGRSFTIAGFKNGEVLVQTDENTARNVVTYAKPYKAATRN